MSIPLLYLDTSAWLKLYVEEDGSEEVNAAVEQAEQTCTHLSRTTAGTKKDEGLEARG